MPFTGQYTYVSPQDYAYNQAVNKLRAETGVNFDPSSFGQQYLMGQNELGPGEYKNPYYGMDKAGVANAFTGGDFNSWFNQYAPTTTGGMPEGQHRLVNGQVAIPQYVDPGDAEGMMVMAALTAGMGGMAAGAAAAGGVGAGASGSGAGATGAFDMGIGGVGESMGLGGGYTGATGLGGSAMDLGDWQNWGELLGNGGGNLMPPAQLDPSVANFLNTGATTPGGGSIFTADGLNPSVLGLGGESAGLWDTIRNLPTSALKALGLQNPDGSANNGSLASLLGKLGAAGLGAYASNQQSNSLSDLAKKYMDFGAPSRARFEASMTPGFDPMSIPGYSGALDTASKSILAKLSATGGNPFGNPGGLIDANKQIVSGTALPAINEYQRLNLAGGGQANLNAAIPGLESSAIGQQGNLYNSIGYGLNAVTNPQPTLADMLKSLQMGGLA